MSQDLSRFPPNSGLGNTDSSYLGHMCYGPTHLNLSTSKESVADWVGAGKSLLPGHHVALVTFEDGTSTMMCEGCGVDAVTATVGDREPEKGETMVGDVTREDMETAGIYEGYRNTFREAAEITRGAVNSDGKLYSWTLDNHVFKVDRDSFTDGASLARAYDEYVGSHSHLRDPYRMEKAQETYTYYETMSNRHGG